MSTYRVFISHSRSPVKRFFRRALAYVGLYADIFSASCRWLVSAPRGWRAPYKTFVTRALKAAGYIPPTQQEIDAANAQQNINAKYALLTFHTKQPETIQTCLKFDPAIWALAYRTSYHPQGLAEGSVPAIPKFVNG